MIPIRVKLFFKYIFLFFLYCIFYRVLFLTFFLKESGVDQFADLAQAFYLGSKFDLRLCALMGLPILFYLWFGRYKLFKTFSLLSFLFILVFFIADLGNFQYLDTRLNATIIRFVETPWISAKLIWQTYPVIRIALFCALLIFIHLTLLKKLFPFIKLPSSSWKQKILPSLISFLVYSLFLYGKFSYYPLRWSEAFFHSNNFISNFTLNPILYFFNTFKFKDVPFEKELVEKYYPAMVDYLKIDALGALGTLNFKREVPQSSSHQYNIIVIVLESLAFDKTSFGTGPLHPTPYLKKIAEEGIFFDHFYTPTESTARGVFATLTGLPDMSLVKTSSRNPLLVNQRVIMDEFKGYDRYYFLGGSANWGNIRGIFSNNIDQIQIFEEGSYKSPRVDVWGISDFDLFRESLEVFKKRQSSSPLVSFIQTSGFHRPYTIPDGIQDFQPKLAKKEELEASGFFSLEQYNSMRFQDFSLQYFIEGYRKLPSFDKTIFLILGDHGLPNRNPKESLSAKNHFNLYLNHVPFIIYAPAIVSPKRITSPGSQLDVFPTAASLAGIPYINTTLGRDLLSNENDSYAFVFNWHKATPNFSLIGKDLIYVFDQPQEGLYSLKPSEDYQKNLKDHYPAQFEKMKDIAHGYYHSARYIRFHNKKAN